MKKRYISMLLAAAAIAATGCSSGGSTTAASADRAADEHAHGEEVEVSQRQINAVGIELGHVETRNLSEIIHVNGETALNPQDMAEVTTLMGGIVKQILVREGNAVKRGQVIAYIENTEIVALQSDYMQSVTELEQAEKELTRQRELEAEGAGIAKNLSAAEAACSMARTAVAGKADQLRQLGLDPAAIRAGRLAMRMPITAPLAGYVSRIDKPIGAYVDPQTPLMTIADNSRLHIDIHVYEKDMPYLKVGQKVDFVLTNNPDEHFTGELYEYDSSFNGEAKTVTAHVRILDRGNSLKLIPGMYVTGTVSTGDHSVEAVPSEAVVSSEGKHFVFVLEGEHEEQGEKFYRFERVEVRTGLEELGYTQILPTDEDLPTHAPIVVKNAFYLSSMLGEAASHDH